MKLALARTVPYTGQVTISLLLIFGAVVALTYVEIVAHKRSSSAQLEASRAIEGVSVAIRDFQFPDIAHPEPVYDPRVDPLLTRMDDLVTAVADGVNRVQRSENRVREIVRGARRELAASGFEHAGVEAEAAQLHEVDGEGGTEEPVQPLPAGVADYEPTIITGIPGRGVTAAHVRLAHTRMRGG